MSDLLSLLSFGSNAIAATNVNIGVTSNNVANANTEGYSRQSADISGNPVRVADSAAAAASSGPVRPDWENNLVQTFLKAQGATTQAVGTTVADTAASFDTSAKSSFPPLFLPAPYGVYDIPLNFTDKKFCPDGQMFATVPDAVPAGDKFCVNGAIQPFFQVKRRKYRFRMLNSGPGRIWTFSLFDNGGGTQPMTVVCTDGNLLTAPIPVTSLQIHVSSRFDVIIDFSKTTIGDHWYLTNIAPQFTQNAPEPNPAPGVNINNVVMRFDIVGDAPDNSVRHGRGDGGVAVQPGQPSGVEGPDQHRALG